MRKLGVGMIGYGGIGRVHVMAYRNIPYHYGLTADTINLVGVATSRSETAQKAAQEIGCHFWTADYHELLARDDIDVVDICVPNHKHEEIITAAAAAGKHIYCEKPLAMDVAEGQRIVEAVEKTGVKSQMTFNFRFFPAISRAKQLMDAGFVGRVFSFRGRYFRSSYIDPQKPLSWRLRKDISGGGALFDLGSHILDILYFLLGDFDRVQATLDTLIKERPVAKGAVEKGAVDVDDIALMQLRMANGTLGNVEISRMGTGVTNDMQFEIYGDQGAIRFRSEDPSWLEVYDVRDPGQPLGGMRGFRKLETVQHYDGAKSPDWSMSPNFVRTHAECQYQFLKAIVDGRPGSPTLSDGLKVQEVMAAAERSSAEGRWVAVAEVR
ncbi:MAG TPA: Gfo/Idh/MocA family oxidoreductase [Anaerolineae bacterium]|nr:Gfo/Idh/MocA family oxidoreductase [Anaerolineales bacterium]HRV91798.1 Gfo/Idh/MocA family oxidoreductase [Anaerolineae bacterium]